MSLKALITRSFPWVACLLFVTSCQKKEEAIPEPAKVNITISSPAPATVFKKGDSVHIAAAVSYTGRLHGYEVRITDKNSGALVGEFEGHVHTDKFDIAETWYDTLSKEATLKLEIRAIIDHDGNDATSEREFKSQP